MGRKKKKQRHIKLKREVDKDMYYVWDKTANGMVQRGVPSAACNAYGIRPVTTVVPQKTAAEKSELQKEMQRIFFANKCSVHLTYEEALQSSKPMSAFPAGNGMGMVRKEFIGGQNVVQIVEKANAVPCLQDVPERINCTIKRKLPYAILRELLAGFKAVYDRDATEAAAQIYRKYTKYAFITTMDEGVQTISFPNINLSVCIGGLDDKKEQIRRKLWEKLACDPEDVLVDVEKKEATILGDFFVYYPKQENTAAHTSYHKDDAAVTTLRKEHMLVMETHSHASMSAFFSGEDDRNELVPLMYCVFGQFNSQSATFKGRIKFNKLEQEFKLNEFFEIPEDVADPLSLKDLPVPSPTLLENAKKEAFGGVGAYGAWTGYDDDYYYTEYCYGYAGQGYNQRPAYVPPNASHIGKHHTETRTVTTIKTETTQKEDFVEVTHANDIEWLSEVLSADESAALVKLLRKKHGFKITLV